MKIALIRHHDLVDTNTRLAKSLNDRQGVLPPLGLAYIASSLEKAGHEVDLIDSVALTLSVEEVSARLQKFDPTVVGITAMTPTIHGALEAASIAKSQNRLTVIGGVHMSIYPRETLSFDSVDFGIVGEGEETIVEFIEALETGQSYENIEGLCYKKSDGSVSVGAARIVQDITSLPFPSYHLMPMDRYSSIIGMTPVSTMMGSRGCPYQCGFCFKTPSDKKYRTRSAEDIVNEIEFLKGNYQVKEIMFYDDIMPPKQAENLSNELIQRNVKIKWQTPERVNLVNPDLLKLMAKSGCHILRFGVEQGDPEMMAFVEKKTTIDKVQASFDAARKAGIDTFAYFIVGYVNETPRTMQATIDLAIKLNPRYVMFTKAVPLPNTPLMQQSVAANLVDPEYWRKYTLGEQQEQMPSLVPDAEKWVKKAYQSFYLRPSKITDQLLRIRSFDDLKKNINGFIGVLNFQMNENALSVQKDHDRYLEKYKPAEQ
jgi:anaerobic magnesium-protoporphyrin IX monomethyl ester cyclase